MATRLGTFAFLLVLGSPIAGAASTTQPASAPSGQYGQGQDPVAVRKALADLESGDWLLQWEAITQLSQWKSPAAVKPLKDLLAGQKVPWLRGRALVALATIQGEGILNEAVALSAADANDLREAAVEALGVIGSPRGAEAVAERLKDPVPAVRQRALLSYARIRKAEAWDVVSKTFAGSDRDAAYVAIRAMAYVGSDESRKKLIELLENAKDPDIRRTAAAALKDARDARTIAAIFERMIEEKDKKVRAACEEALQSFDKDQLTAPLIQVLRTEQAELYPPALKLLAANPSKEASLEVASRMGWIAQKAPESLATAMVILARFEPDAHLDVFARHLNDKSADVRLAAVEGLSRCGKADLYALLRDRLIDTEPSIRSAAFEALRATAQRLPEGGLAEYLSATLKSADPSVCWNAISLMRGRLTGAEFPKALAVLDRFLGGSDEKVRDLAVSVLAPADPRAVRQIALAEGYLMNWAVIGPFPNDQENSGLSTAYGPEEEVDLAKKYKGLEDKDVFWLRHELKQLDATVELNSMFWEKAPYKVAYATVELKADQDRTIYLAMEGAGSFLVWANGAKAGQLTEGEKQQVPLKLQKGANRLLVKACKSVQGTNWWLRARLTDKSGQRADGVTIEK